MRIPLGVVRVLVRMRCAIVVHMVVRMCHSCVCITCIIVCITRIIVSIIDVSNVSMMPTMWCVHSAHMANGAPCGTAWHTMARVGTGGPWVAHDGPQWPMPEIHALVHARVSRTPHTGDTRPRRVRPDGPHPCIETGCNTGTAVRLNRPRDTRVRRRCVFLRRTAGVMPPGAHRYGVTARTRRAARATARDGDTPVTEQQGATPWPAWGHRPATAWGHDGHMMHNHIAHPGVTMCSCGAEADVFTPVIRDDQYLPLCPECAAIGCGP